MWPSSRTSVAARSACSSPATQSEIAPEVMSAAGYSAMSSMLTPASPERQRQLGDGPGPVGDDDPQLAQRAAGELGLEQAAPVARRPRRARRRRRSRSPARISSAASRSRPTTRVDRRRRPPRGCRAKMSPQIAGFAPATRVASRKLGPTSGRRSESLVELRVRPGRRGRWRRTCGRWLTVAISRSCASALDRLRPGAELGDRALQAVVEDAAGAARSGSGTSGRPRRGRRGRCSTPAVSAPGQRMAADEALVVARAPRPPRA